MNWLLRNAEIIGTVAGFVCVWLTVRQNVWAWPLGIVNNFFFLLVLAQDRLYANVGLQAAFMILGFYGWWAWLYGGAGRTHLRVSRLQFMQVLLCLGLGISGTIALALGLQALARQTGLPPPANVYWDSSITAASLVAQWMLTRKKLENWWVWILAVNLSQIFLFAQKERYLMAALQIAYIALSVQGYRAWCADLAAPPAENSGVPVAAIPG